MVGTEEQITEGAPQQVGDPPLCQVVRPVVDQVAALAKALQVTRPIVCRVVIEVRRGEDDARVANAGRLLDVRPAGCPAAASALGARGGVEPTAVGQAADGLAMWPSASLAATTATLEPHLPADLWPVDRVEPAQLRLDRHRGFRSLFAEEAIDARPADAEPAGDRRRAELLVIEQPPDFVGIDRWFPALVDAARLGGADPFKLPLAPQIGLEFGEYAEHVEERLASRGAGVDRLLGRLQGDTPGLELVHDILDVLQRPCQTIDAGDDERVAGAQEVEQDLQFGAPVAPRRLLRTNNLAAGGLEGSSLDREILVEGRNSEHSHKAT